MYLHKKGVGKILTKMFKLCLAMLTILVCQDECSSQEEGYAMTETILEFGGDREDRGKQSFTNQIQS